MYVCQNTLTHKLINVCNTLHNADNTHTHTVHMNICMYIKNNMYIYIYMYIYICMNIYILVFVYDMHAVEYRLYPSDLGNFARLAGQIRI